MDLSLTKNLAKQIRKDIVEMTYAIGTSGTHIGGSLSMVELITVLYNDFLLYDKNNMQNENRDRFILSKGHGAMAMYAIMHRVGILSDEEIATFKKDGTLYATHPLMNLEKGIEFSTGSLGHGLSLGVGSAIALKLKNNKESKIVVMMGDGECDEGSIWEAAMSAHHYNLDNLILIIDRNHLQLDGEINTIMNLISLENKFKSFGWDVSRIKNGHNVEEIYDVLSDVRQKQKSPHVVIAETIKGKGVSFIENKYNWHIGVLSKDQYEQACKELEVL